MNTPLGSSSSASCAYELPSQLTIETIEPCAEELKRVAISEKMDCVLGASAVEQITTPGVQLLVALERSLSALGSGLVVSAPSPVLVRALQALGLERLCEGASASH